MERVFNDKEIQELIINPLKYNERLIQKIVEFFQSNGVNIPIVDDKMFYFDCAKKTRPVNLEWHFDDIIYINYIVCIYGPGTIIKDIDGSIIQLKPGYGYPVVGAEAFKVFNMMPTLHKAPESDEERMLLRMSIVGGPNTNNYFSSDKIIINKVYDDNYNKNHKKINLSSSGQMNSITL